MFASVIALLAAGAAASGSPPPSSAPPPKPTVAAKPSDQDLQNQVVCHTDIPLGSRLGGVRVCKTRGEWEQLRRASQEATENQQVQGIQNGGK